MNRRPSPISNSRESSGRLLFISGQIAMGSDGVVAHPGDPRAQAVMAFEQIGAALAEHGCTFDSVVKLTTFVVDARDIAAISDARADFFTGPYPTATTVAVAALARPGLLVEVEAIAELPDA